MRTGILSLDHVASGLSKTVGVIAVTAALLTQSTALANAAEKYAAFVIDANNGKVLFAKNADDPRYPASLTKMMTLYLVFEAMRKGRLELDSRMKVSAYAAARPPSKIGLKPGATISVEEGIYSLVTKSANDVSVVIAEHLGGTEARFATMMTAKAHQLGMSRTTFKNPHGLPNPGQKTTARDMATLGMALREHFPRQYSYFKAKSFNFRGRTIGSHNRLVGRIKGVDGIKTGYINASGFNLVTSLAIDDKKIVGVVMGGKSGASRDNHMAELMNKYIKVASNNERGPLIAAPKPTEPRVTVAAVSEYSPPSRVPVPRQRTSVSERIAAAYGSDVGAEVATNQTERRPLLGREALRAALGSSRPTANPLRQMAVPAANSLAPSVPVPRGEIPGGADFDPTTTGSIKARMADVPASAWVVQIAAMPDRDRAMDMLSEAKAKGGNALVEAVAFTEAVESGSQTLHRARFAGFQSKTEAAQACAVLKKRSYNCFAIAN